MKRLRIAAAALLCAVGLSAFAQTGVRYDSRVTTAQTNMPAGANTPVLAIPNARVLVCATSLCTTPTNIYQDQALTVLADNPIIAGAQSPANLSGSWGFWGAAGTYYYKITTSQGITYGPFPITLGGAGGGGDLTTASEVPAGTIDGVNRIFTVSHTPIMLMLQLNGLVMTSGVDYTLSASTITFTGSIPRAGTTPDKLYANYFYGSTGTLTPFTQVPTGTINGSNTAFTLTHAPTILFLTRNGVQLVAGGVDYTLTGTSLTMTAAPVSGDVFNAQYFY